MKVTWLGQAGLLFETSGLTIMIDPYLSNSCGKANPRSNRRVPVDESLYDIHPDVMIFTHNHLDHYDPETVDRIFELTDKPMIILSPVSVWNEVRKHGLPHNYVQFNTGSEWTEGAVRFTALKAEHSDAAAIGVVLEAEGKRYYVTGDTLYNHAVLATVPADIEAVFLPINGVGNNMNAADAARFAAAIGAKKVVPLHIGLMDDKNFDIFECENKVVPSFYQEIPL